MISWSTSILILCEKDKSIRWDCILESEGYYSSDVCRLDVDQSSRRGNKEVTRYVVTCG